MKTKAFTLVELIVVITILAILWTISFISLQWYSKDARDTKRLSDVKSLLTKITIEEAKWVSLENLITNSTWKTIILNWEQVEAKVWYPDFETLRENEASFTDPTMKKSYPIAYARYQVQNGWVTRNQTDIAMAYKSERTNEWVCKWVWVNYRELFSGASGAILTDNTEVICWEEWSTWNIPQTPPTPTYSCATQPNYTNASFVVWSPTSENEAWQNTNNLNPCYYECTNWYTW
jgi:prepilin-type N-terminal cleavage/methylation domain-containing protein